MGFSLFRRRPARPDNMLAAGWQFYARPTNLEPPGTVFRIDPDGNRYLVHRLMPDIERGPEPSATKIERIETKMGALARLVSLTPVSAKVSSGKTAILEFEIREPVRESTTDGAIDKVLKPFFATMEFRRNNQYYVIREARSATYMKYTLSGEQLGEIGGEATVQAAMKAELMLSAKRVGTYELSQAFPERLGIMFLPDEIAPTRESLAGGETELGRIPVRGVLNWVESDPP